MTAAECSIGIDVGSTNVKVVLVDAAGTTHASAQRILETRRFATDSGDAAEQDAAELWANVLDALGEVVAAARGAAAQVRTIGVCSQYSSIVPVDAAGEPVGPLVMWTDKRGTDRCWAILGEHEEAFATWVERHGIPPIGSGLALAHLLYLQEERHEIHERTVAWLEPMDYVNARLTGRIAATQHTMFMSQVVDNRTLGVTEYEPDLVRMAGLDATRLPRLVDIDAAIGPLSAGVASALGLSPDVVVYAGTNDTTTDAVATGAFRRGRGGLAIGTTSVLIDTVDEQGADYDHEILAMPGPFGRYLVWAENGIGGKALEHVLEHVVYAVDVLGEHLTDDHFAALDDALDATPIGSDGVLFLPFLNGSLSPDADPNMRGTFLNIGLDTGRTQLVRAVVEGVAFNLRRLLPHVEAFTAAPMDEIVFVGGAARSGGWCQILADVLERPILPAVDPGRAVARGAALLALCRHGVLDRDELEHTVATSATFEPRAEASAVYAPLAAQFDAAALALKPIYAALNG